MIAWPSFKLLLHIRIMHANDFILELSISEFFFSYPPFMVLYRRTSIHCHLKVSDVDILLLFLFCSNESEILFFLCYFTQSQSSTGNFISQIASFLHCELVIKLRVIFIGSISRFYCSVSTIQCLSNDAQPTTQ